MSVLQWAFGRTRGNPHALANIRARQVVYTSTHDTDTAAGWYRALSAKQRRETGLDPAEPSWGLIELALGSRAGLAVVPAQDVLGLGSDARMNRPGRANGNWSWRLRPGELTDELASRLRAVTVRERR
jgi:4-alpha-glucanotransferase